MYVFVIDFVSVYFASDLEATIGAISRKYEISAFNRHPTSKPQLYKLVESFLKQLIVFDELKVFLIEWN